MKAEGERTVTISIILLMRTDGMYLEKSRYQISGFKGSTAGNLYPRELSAGGMIMRVPKRIESSGPSIAFGKSKIK